MHIAMKKYSLNFSFFLLYGLVCGSFFQCFSALHDATDLTEAMHANGYARKIHSPGSSPQAESYVARWRYLTLTSSRQPEYKKASSAAS